MRIFASVTEIEAELAQYAPSRMSNAVYNLDRITKLLRHLSNPQNKLRVLHVTGTSGKTSTSYFLRSILEASGKKVGLTVSPHITTIRERLQLNGDSISEVLFIRYFNQFYPQVFSFEPHPTYFELMTAFVYWVFEKEKVQYAVIEVGLGGRYDATNTVSRDDKVCVINSIGYDHTEILGGTLTTIAGEKAGIIQKNNKVFTVPQDDEARVVLENEVKQQHADMTVVHPALNSQLSTPLFQQHNFQLALAAARFVADRDGMKLPKNVESLVDRVLVPGRYETYLLGDKTVILDGAHNPQKLSALIDVLTNRHMQPAIVVAGLSEAPGTKVIQCVKLLSGFSAKTLYTTFTVQRDVTRHSVQLEVFSEIKREQDELVEKPEEALQKALQNDETVIVLTGSLYLVSILRPMVRRLAGLSD